MRESKNGDGGRVSDSTQSQDLQHLALSKPRFANNENVRVSSHGELVFVFTVLLVAAKQGQRQGHLDDFVAIDTRADGIDNKPKNIWLMRYFIDGKKILLRERQVGLVAAVRLEIVDRVCINVKEEKTLAFLTPSSALALRAHDLDYSRHSHLAKKDHRGVMRATDGEILGRGRR